MGIESLLGCCGFSSKPHDVAGRVELGDAEALRVRAPGRGGCRRPRGPPRTRSPRRPGRAAQDVVTEDDAEAVLAHEVAGQADGMGDAQRAALVAVGEVQAEVVAVGEQLDDVADAAAAQDDHDLADAHARQRLEREVDHGPVVDRHEVLVGDLRQRVEA